MDYQEQRPSKRILVTTSIITFIGFLDTHLLIPIVALYAVGLGASGTMAGLIVGLYSIFNTPANVFFGRLIDRIGYKAPLIVGLIGDAISMFLYSLCRLPIHLVLLRIFHGASGGLVGPATMSITSTYSDSTRKARTFSFYGISLAAATLAGYGLCAIPWLQDQHIFYLGAGLLAIAVVLAFLLPANRNRSGRTAVASPVDTLRQVKSLLKRKLLTIAYCSIFAQYFTFGGVVILVPFYLDTLGMERIHVATLLITFAVMFIAAQFPSGWLSDKIGRRWLIDGGLVLAIISLVLLPNVSALPLMVVMMALYGIAYALIFPSISALVAEHSSPGERGVATGVFHALLTAGVAIGAPVMGWLGESVGVKPGIMLTAAAVFLALLFAFASRPRNVG